MPVIETPVKEAPIEMTYHDAPNAGAEARAISASGMKMRDELNSIRAEASQLTIPQRLALARKDSFGFMGLWGRDSGDSTVVACASLWLAGFDGKNPELQRKAGKEILSRIVSLDDAVPIPYGLNKYAVFIETDEEPDVWLRRAVEAQTVPTIENFPKENFPLLEGVPEELQRIREQELFNLEDGTRPFVDAFYGKTNGPERAFQANGNEYFAWEYRVGEDGDLYAVNPDGRLQALSELISGSTLDETALLMEDIANFLRGQRGRKRIVLQFDFGEDAACSNIAINANQEPFLASSSLSIAEVMREAESILSQNNPSGEPRVSGGGGGYKELSNYCSTCEEKKSDCTCN